MTNFRPTMQPSEFLTSFEETELIRLHVLNQSRRLLNSASVEPLLQLMRDNGVRELKSGNWFLDVDRAFCNPNAQDSRYRSGIAHLGGAVRMGVVFEGQNDIINPYFQSRTSLQQSAEESPVIEYDQSIFINEVVSSPENRVNLNLFGLLNIREFREWFFERIGVPSESILFPTKNTAADDAVGRPDYEIQDGENRFIAYVEVELGGENGEQLSRYRTMAAANAGRVVSIVGRREWGGDLSLEEILEAVTEVRPKAGRQVEKYCNAYEAMYCEYVLGRSSRSYTTAEVSDEMREHRFVIALCEHLPVTFDISGPMAPGEFRMNTKMDKGMSLRVYSSISKTHSSLATASISGGRDRVLFPSREKLLKFLPRKTQAIEDYTKAIKAMGYDITELGEKNRASVPLATVMLHIEPLASAIRQLGNI